MGGKHNFDIFVKFVIFKVRADGGAPSALRNAEFSEAESITSAADFMRATAVR